MTAKRKRRGGLERQLLPPGRTATGQRWWTLVAAVTIAAAAVATYANSFAGKFVFDDAHTIVNSADISQLWPPWRSFSGHRPLVELSLAANYGLGRLNVWGYHAFNLAVHILAGVLLFGVVRRTLLTDRLRDRFGRAATALALAAALFWTLHPLQTSSVTYITQRFEAVMATFYLLMLYCAIRAASAQRLWWHAAAAASAALGMASKEVMVTAPLVLLLYDRVFLWQSWRQLLRRRWELYGVLAGMWLLLGLWIWPRVAAAFAAAKATTGAYAATQCQVIAHYLRLAFWPDALCLDYWWQVAGSAGEVLPELVLMVGLIGLTVWALWRRPAAGFVGAAFFVILAPTSSFFPITDAAFEHRMYLPLAAVAALVVCLAYLLVLSRLPPPVRTAAAAAAVIVVAALLGWRTVRRNADYHDSMHMWQDVVRLRPDNPRAHNNMGVILLQRDQAEPAQACFKKALQVDPTYVKAGQNLTIARSWSDDSQLAAEKLTAWLNEHPDSPVAHQNLAAILDKQGRLDEAIANYRAAIKLRYNYPQAHSQLGAALARKGQDAEAIRWLTKAIQIRPHYADGHYNLGVFYARRGNFDQAQRHLQEALRLDAAHAKAHLALGGVRLAQSRPKDAAGYFRQAAELAKGPQRAKALCGLAAALAAGGDGKAAVEQYRQVLTINPDNPAANNGLARLLATWPDSQLRDGAEAVALAEKACRATGNASAACLDTLAAAYAESGRFADAQATIQRAIRLATQAGDTYAAKNYAARLQLYQVGQCFREVPGQ